MQTEKSFKHVTNRQCVKLGDLAREANVSREEFASFLKDEKRRNKFFDNLKNGDGWFEKLQVEASKIGARVYCIPKLRVDYTKTHNEAAQSGGLQPGLYVLDVGDKYLLPVNTIVEEVIILLNYPHGGGNYQVTVKWGLQNSLEETVPHEIFAIGEQFPYLNYTLGPNPMIIVETESCLFNLTLNACVVSWENAERESHLVEHDRLDRDDAWFAFRKKISPKK